MGVHIDLTTRRFWAYQLEISLRTLLMFYKIGHSAQLFPHDAVNLQIWHPTFLKAWDGKLIREIQITPHSTFDEVYKEARSTIEKIVVKEERWFTLPVALRVQSYCIVEGPEEVMHPMYDLLIPDPPRSEIYGKLYFDFYQYYGLEFEDFFFFI